MEVLFCFLNWAASFSVVDEETGSKMDVHNLATVIAPNICFSNNKTAGIDDSFHGIEAVAKLISYNDVMAEVPEDIQIILSDPTVFSDSAEMSTKEIIKRLDDFKKGGQLRKTGTMPQDSTRTRSSHGSNPVVVATQDNAPAWHAETQVRTATGSNYNTPGVAQNGFYGTPGSQYGSRDSFGANGSPHRYPPGGAAGGRHVAT